LQPPFCLSQQRQSTYLLWLLAVFFSTGISDTVPRKFLLQTGSNTATITRHHRHHFLTLSLEHLHLSHRSNLVLHCNYLQPLLYICMQGDSYMHGYKGPFIWCKKVIETKVTRWVWQKSCPKYVQPNTFFCHNWYISKKLPMNFALLR
jgi:hypothetical protein